MDYREALLLWAARETGILEAVATSCETPAEVAAETGVTERAARIVVEAMAELGYLEAVGDASGDRTELRYEITNRALGFVAKADVRSIGSVPHALDCVDRWIRLPETMACGEPPAPETASEDWTENFVGAMASVDDAAVRASVTAAVHRNPNAERVLDAGGGPGVFAKEFVRRGFDVTLVDRPEVVDIDRRFLEHEPIELVAGDITEKLPADDFDLVFCSRVAHGLSPDENRRFLAEAFDALAPGGAVVLTDRVRGRAEDAALFGAHMLAQTEAGDTYTEDQFTSWLREAGFEDVEVRDVPGFDRQVIAGRRPGD
ncbi:methyltransferase domain-containing protein [Halorussus gelatinilyticus]|uniref:Methyltransferase domain-containing protein n=1 Tax=Halorussus gelatinilyticus TaxID=2937524 RepID=A0A8U0IMB3_9EURY|nr:class I SAM-dependent methyltransferase [Halorussus gelatinilyticus]UPW02267.1 methyltransferase domain-containing protein [Halorussus gelatinilyticus]